MTVVPGQLPGVVGVGTDLVDVERLRRALDLTRVCVSGSSPSRSGTTPFATATLTRTSQRGFAAKEAVMKALGHGMSSMGFAEIEVVRDESGAPSIALERSAAEVAAAAGVSRWHLSLTHTDALAQAVAVAVGSPVATGAGTTP